MPPHPHLTLSSSSNSQTDNLQSRPLESSPAYSTAWWKHYLGCLHSSPTKLKSLFSTLLPKQHISYSPYPVKGTILPVPQALNLVFFTFPWSPTCVSFLFSHQNDDFPKYLLLFIPLPLPNSCLISHVDYCSSSYGLSSCPRPLFLQCILYSSQSCFPEDSSDLVIPAGASHQVRCSDFDASPPSGCRGDGRKKKWLPFDRWFYCSNSPTLCFLCTKVDLEQEDIKQMAFPVGNLYRKAYIL